MSSVSEFFEGLPARVDPSRIAGMTNTYAFDIEGAGAWTVAIVGFFSFYRNQFPVSRKVLTDIADQFGFG